MVLSLSLSRLLLVSTSVYYQRPTARRQRLLPAPNASSQLRLCISISLADVTHASAADRQIGYLANGRVACNAITSCLNVILCTQPVPFLEDTK